MPDSQSEERYMSGVTKLRLLSLVQAALAALALGGAILTVLPITIRDQTTDTILFQPTDVFFGIRPVIVLILSMAGLVLNAMFYARVYQSVGERAVQQANEAVNAWIKKHFSTLLILLLVASLVLTELLMTFINY